MRTPQPLPSALAGKTLTPRVLHEAGVHRSRLRRRDITALARGISLQREHVPAQSTERFRQRAVVLARAREGCWISHTTAAVLRGWWLPTALHDVETVHLTLPKVRGTRTRLDRVQCHRATKAPRRLEHYDGARVSAPELTWLELASSLEYTELIALGDHLVRQPYPQYESRSHPWAGIERLRAVVSEAAGMHGVKKARAALPLVRVGADSPQETALRLAVLDAGLPEPELQVPAAEGDPWSPRADLGYRRHRVAMQYDGATHFDAEQARKDQARNNAFIAAGWTLLLFNRDDARTGFTRAVTQIRSVLAR